MLNLSERCQVNYLLWRMNKNSHNNCTCNLNVTDILEALKLFKPSNT